MKPVIGVIPLFDEERDSYWMLPGYNKVVEQCGGLPLMLPLTEDPAALRQCFDLCDGLLLTGGQDVDPALYGEEPLPQCGVLCPERDRMEALLLDWAVKEDKPVFGICRGLQFMNAFLGGTLYQDIPTQHPGTECHHMSAPYDREIHTVSLTEGGMAARLLGKTTLGVNSLHHQAVKVPAPCLTVDAVSPEGIVEAAHLPGKRFFLGVQWHPEFSYTVEEDSVRLVQAFVDSCRA